MAMQEQLWLNTLEWRMTLFKKQNREIDKKKGEKVSVIVSCEQ